MRESLLVNVVQREQKCEQGQLVTTHTSNSDSNLPNSPCPFHHTPSLTGPTLGPGLSPSPPPWGAPPNEAKNRRGQCHQHPQQSVSRKVKRSTVPSAPPPAVNTQQPVKALETHQAPHCCKLSAHRCCHAPAAAAKLPSKQPATVCAAASVGTPKPSTLPQTTGERLPPCQQQRRCEALVLNCLLLCQQLCHPLLPRLVGAVDARLEGALAHQGRLGLHHRTPATRLVTCQPRGKEGARGESRTGQAAQ